MASIGRRLLTDAKTHAQSQSTNIADSKSQSNTTDDDEVTDLEGRDVFSLLVKANMTEEAGVEKLSDADVLARACFFLP